MVVSSPYQHRAARSFWKTGVQLQDWTKKTGLHKRKFPLTVQTPIVTAGSCFAQHIARHLRKRGFRVVDSEPAPRRMPPEVAQNYGYQLYSARYGNIYTVRQLLQLVQEATRRQPKAAEVWKRNGRYYDALRPSVEPKGLETPEEIQLHRDSHLKAVRRMLRSCEVFVFTFGLTEAWVNKETGVVYPTAPGTLAGDYDPARYAFINFTFREIYDDFVAFRKLMKRLNPKVNFLVTVSPVPLTATASDDHVLPATVYSKSVLRAVAGQLSKEFDDVDYFPSYEIVATPFSGKIFYDESMRAVTEEGVATVMRIFFEEIDQEREEKEKASASDENGRTGPGAASKASREEEAVCEDVLLEAFAP
jgi:hypothetical protein